MFKTITFRQEEIPGMSVSKYRDYTDHNNYVLVEAGNAQTAISTSGVKTPVRVLRDSIYLENVLMLDKPPIPVIKAEPVAPAAAEAPPPAEASAPEPPAPETLSPAETGDATLSSDDVNKLLNSQDSN